MNVLDVDLYQFELVYRICFRKVVQKKEKGVELNVLTPCISVSCIKFLNISSLVPPDAYSNRAELHPRIADAKVRLYFEIANTSVIFYCLYFTFILKFAVYQCFLIVK